MINFGDLELKVNTKYSFVGIEKEGSKLIFHIPKGFSESDSSLNTFDSKRDLFFRLYRVLNLFKQTCIEKGYFKTGVITKADDRDGVVEDDTGSEITSNDDSKNIFYSKIDALGSILDAYDELKILALVSRLGKSERIDYSKLHRYLNKAVFLNNGAIYIDAMNLPRKEIHFDATDIVAMYCYIFAEIKEQLKQEINPEINPLAERFREKYLGSESSLFNEKYHLQVINELKDALESIDNYTPIKDSDYWDFYEAIEKFLFGELDTSIQGEIWGFSNFYSIWEAMCLTYLVKTVDPDFILYLDKQFMSDKILSKWDNCNKIIDISKIFILKDTDNPSVSDKESKLRPDAVIISFCGKERKESLFTNQKTSASTLEYQLDKDDKDWDDYGYRTTFKFRAEPIKKTKSTKITVRIEDTIKIADINQSCGERCFQTLTINSNMRLAENLYSYWDINDISIDELTRMRCLNHIFYQALKTKDIDYKKFLPSLIQHVFGNNSNIYNNVIFDSLVRKRSKQRDLQEMKGNVEKLNQLFADFLKKLHFYIIDIKYHNSDYFARHQNIEEIKRDSIRKQFLYEYLLQKHLEDTKSLLKELDIKSDFWLPAYSSTQELLTPLPKYMDDYIKLTGVNIMAVIDSYLETEEK
ncbi:hypothetical protein Cylst_2785 [Cylindrospermum stagnale PCC 7417]|uniref:Uncharacterized protein n=1 Tax=Cylindrospermum stagnale PCC 7417 TaxID=56107 RepID=K9WZP1_9NOST|nr:hypothetical protein [Cylindrospermum stagnale]AFZ24982.1 hypothetical protein Cylst_2785 [Cylindrospermum stagnale PCC 7417]